MKLFINGDIIRQLNNIFKLSFKSKYKKEIKARLLIFVNRLYEDISFKDLKLFKEEIELKGFEINELKEGFFEKYRNELLGFLNPEWYEEKEKFIPTKKDREYFVSFIILDVLNKTKEKLRNDNEHIRMAFDVYNHEPYYENRILTSANFYLKEKRDFIKRNSDIKEAKKIITKYYIKSKNDIKEISWSNKNMKNQYKNIMLKTDEFATDNIIKSVMATTWFYDCVLCAKMLKELETYY